MSTTTTHTGGTLSRRAGPQRTLLITALVLASALAISVAIAPQTHARGLAAAPPASEPAGPSAPEEGGPDAERSVAVKGIPCPPLHICLFQYTEYEGHIAPFRFTGSRDLKDQNFNDGTSSIRNNSHQGWCVYEHANYGGVSAYVKPGSVYRKLHSWWNDRISSLQIVASRDDCAAPG